MHTIIQDGVEKRVSFETWQRNTNIHYEDDRKQLVGAMRKTKKKDNMKPRTRLPIPPPPKPKPRPSMTGTDKNSIVGGLGKNRRISGKTQLNLDPKHFVVGSSPKRDVIGGSHYSRALLVDAQPLTQGPGPDNLKYFADVDHLFFKPCKKFPPEIKGFNPKHKRGIWNAGGRCVYYVGQTNYYTFHKFRSGFTYEVVDYLGRLVLTSQGSQWNFGLRGKVSVTLGDGFLLGTMEQEFLGSTYSIRDGRGRVVYTIQAPCYIPAVPFVVWCFVEEFQICMDDGISEIGKIIRWWEDEFQDFEGDLGLEFDSTDDNRVKALLLGVYFLIEFQYYKYGGNGVSYFCFMLVGCTALAFVLSNGFGFFPVINSPLITEEVVEN